VGAFLFVYCHVDTHQYLHRPVDPNTYGDPYDNPLLDRPISVLSTSSSGIENAWRRRQTIKRGVTRKVQLTNGNFIAEYAVPTPVHSAIESKWKAANSTEFSYVSSDFSIF
jgi:chitin synthase